MGKPIDPTKGDGATAVSLLARLRTRAADVRKNRADDTAAPVVTTLPQAQKEIRDLRRRVRDLEAFASVSARVDGLIMDPDDDDRAGTE